MKKMLLLFCALGCMHFAQAQKKKSKTPKKVAKVIFTPPVIVPTEEIKALESTVDSTKPAAVQAVDNIIIEGAAYPPPPPPTPPPPPPPPKAPKKPKMIRKTNS